MRNKVIQAAKAWLGCNEADGSHKPIIDLYNTIKPLPAGYKLSYTDAWCAAFVSASARKAGCTDIVFPECSCERMISLYKKAGRWQENDAYTPQPGDIIFYDWNDNGSGDNVGSSDHVGIVTAVNGSTITVIEGNISDKVGYRNISVNGRYIRGYGLPDYDNGGKVTSSTETNKSTVKEKTVTVQLRQLSKGMTGEDVKSLQLLLVGKGFSVGKDSKGKDMIDGEFGSKTFESVKRFQLKKKLTVDGIVGAQTYAALIK